MKVRKFYEKNGNIEKYHELARKCKASYRKRTGSNLYAKKEWDFVEDAMVLEHSISDRELAKILERSVTSIQIRRSRLKHHCE